ncbi:hypothetical protein HCN44_004750 [Aphidius gifuensis]|uniref:Uncharacterized protein n=1 Tax=Aphidius gifuensis TaxID=684658 RepID=A0A834XXF4_APHGI|nr:SET and MYND domain-containing protein 4-like [Aphidius gifuensis]KAF7995278.1 hypothetical protein HCN44_004750 [Aphidius gifuensis]
MDNIEITQPELESWKKDIHLKIVDTINYATQGLGLDLNNDRQNIIERCIDNLVDKKASRYIPTPENIRTKDNFISTIYQAEGKLHYNDKDYNESWIKYTKAIAYALPDSLELTYAYSNRSAALFEAEMHDDCLKDLSRLKYMKIFPDNAKLLANLRALKSHRIIADRELSTSLRYANKKEVADQVDKIGTRALKLNSEIAPIILEKNNLEVPSLSDSTQLNYSREYGRHITAKKDIKFGEVIGVEHAYASNIVQDLKYNLCGYCKKQTWSSIPCNNCAHVVYCSESCKINADNDYHRVECKIIPYLLAFGIKDKYLLALRLTIIGMLESVYRPDKIPTKKNLSSFDPRSKGFMNGRLRSDVHTSVVSMQTSISGNLIDQECVSLADCFIMAYFLLINMDDLPSDHDGDLKDLKTRKKFMNVVGLIDRSVRILMNNGLEVSMPQANVKNQRIHMGSALVIPFSLFNHSCQPMVIISRHGDQFIMRATCPIKKGQQIFTNYGVTWYCHDKQKRQEFLNFYNFTCKCDACCGDWIHSEKSDKKVVKNNNKVRNHVFQTLENLVKAVEKGQLQNTSSYYLTENRLTVKPGDLEVYLVVLNEFYKYFNINSSRAVELSYLFSDFVALTQAAFIQFFA